MSTRGFLGMFSKAAPAADVTKLKPGIALPHVTLPTTEVRTGALAEPGAEDNRKCMRDRKGCESPTCAWGGSKGSVETAAPPTRLGRLQHQHLPASRLLSIK